MKKILFALIILIIGIISINTVIGEEASGTGTYRDVLGTGSAAPAAAGQSVVYYLEKINESIAKSDGVEKTLSPDSKPTPSTGGTSQNGTASKINTFVWEDVRGGTTGYTIIFPETTYNGKKGTLSLWFYTNPVAESLAQYISVSLDGKEVDCGQERSFFPKLIDFYSKRLNFIAATNERTCVSEFANNNIALVTVEKPASNYKITVESPLIPDGCKAASNNAASGRVLYVTCK